MCIFYAHTHTHTEKIRVDMKDVIQPMNKVQEEEEMKDTLVICMMEWRSLGVSVSGHQEPDFRRCVHYIHRVR